MIINKNKQNEVISIGAKAVEESIEEIFPTYLSLYIPGNIFFFFLSAHCMLF